MRWAARGTGSICGESRSPDDLRLGIGLAVSSLVGVWGTFLFFGGHVSGVEGDDCGVGLDTGLGELLRASDSLWWLWEGSMAT